VNSSKVFEIFRKDLDDIRQEASFFKDFKNVLVIGTGGSALGGKALFRFGIQKTKTSVKVIFLENVDSLDFLNAIRDCPRNETGVIVISKSGRTTEPLMLFATLLELWRGFDCTRNALVITEDSEENDLLRLAKEKGIRIFFHDKEIGGRFSIFSVVGLLPSVIANIDVQKFLDGAKKVLRSFDLEKNYHQCSIFNEALLQYKVISAGVNQHVVMCYSACLASFTQWCCQLIAESLGKKESFGVTPIAACGTIDQHSMLQLFLEGPKDKYFTIITQQNNAGTVRIGNLVSSRVLNILSGHNINELMIAHQTATIEALKKRADVRVLHFDEFDLESLGFIMMTFVIETIAIGLIADIDPFNQPGVEEVKRRVLIYLDEIKSKKVVNV
jgi:glucose-6-phosphate isomerase